MDYRLIPQVQLKITEVIKHAHPCPDADDAAFEASDKFAGAHLFFEGDIDPIAVDADWYRKHDPQPGDNYVIYQGGYTDLLKNKAGG